MPILCQTAKFKSVNILAKAIWDPTAKFNSRQYFRLYSRGFRYTQHNWDKHKRALHLFIQCKSV